MLVVNQSYAYCLVQNIVYLSSSSSNTLVICDVDFDHMKITEFFLFAAKVLLLKTLATLKLICSHFVETDICH